MKDEITDLQTISSSSSLPINISKQVNLQIFFY